MPDPRWLAGMVCATQLNVATQGGAGASPDDFMPAWPDLDAEAPPADAGSAVVPQSVAELAKLMRLAPPR